MSEPNEQDREKAREVIEHFIFNVQGFDHPETQNEKIAHAGLISAVANAVAEARAEGLQSRIGEHKWVRCPVCDEPDMLAIFEGEKNDPTGHGWLVQCTNLACESNLSVHADGNRKHDRDEAFIRGQCDMSARMVEVARKAAQRYRDEREQCAPRNAEWLTLDAKRSAAAGVYTELLVASASKVDSEIPIGLICGEHQRAGGTHIEWHVSCGCAYHPEPFPYIHPCSDEHKRPDLHTSGERRLATREDAERFIQRELSSAQWLDEKLMISFEKESLIHALVEKWEFEMEPRRD